MEERDFRLHAVFAIFVVCQLFAPCAGNVLVGDACPDSNCTELDFGECVSGACVCQPGYFVTNNRNCSQIPIIGEACPDISCTGLENGECIQGGCNCRDGYFGYTEQQECYPRGAPGENCSSVAWHPLQCVDNANCSDDQCLCDDAFFVADSVCLPRVLAGGECNSTISDVRQCVGNATCLLDTGTVYTCQCDQGFYNDSGTCLSVPDTTTTEDTTPMTTTPPPPTTEIITTPQITTTEATLTPTAMTTATSTSAATSVTVTEETFTSTTDVETSVDTTPDTTGTREETPADTTEATGGTSPPVGAIAGGVVAGVVVITAVIVVYYCVQRRRSGHAKPSDDRHSVPTATDFPNPAYTDYLNYERVGSSKDSHTYESLTPATHVPHNTGYF